MHVFPEHETDTSNHIVVERLRLPARLGILEHERLNEQTVCVDLELGLSRSACFESDAIGDTIDYSVVASRLRELATRQHYNLVEYLAEQMAGLVLQEFGAAWVRLRIRKIGVVPGCRYVGVSILRHSAHKAHYGDAAITHFDLRSSALLR